VPDDLRGTWRGGPLEIARELRLDVSNIAYHVTALAETNLIEWVGSQPVRGAEDFYRAIELLVITAEQEEERSDTDRLTFAETTRERGPCARGGVFALAQRQPPHARGAHNDDEEGWDELIQVYAELCERVVDIQATAAGRMTDDTEPMRVVSFRSLFEMPRETLSQARSPDLTPLAVAQIEALPVRPS
jgi:hypothetical protein